MSSTPEWSSDTEPHEGAAEHLPILAMALAEYGVPMVELHSEGESPVDPEEAEGACTLELVLELVGTSELTGSPARALSEACIQESVAIEEEVEAERVSTSSGAYLTRETVMVEMVQESEPPSIPRLCAALDVPNSMEIVAELTEPPSLLASRCGPCHTEASLGQAWSFWIVRSSVDWSSENF
ncbi:hypothetical protein Nepgr_007187 [Nepenthes gracilis]|uniref:Uncharacterized protein n=1 Tax=Nepenthes gracilis TaxID=150966 RepID=A0AAD3S6E1_NEPGR|nr:hypothetical protein Nepgr_007187 [Nepenthes gracilis]